MELEDDTKGEKSLFEISSNTNNQEEATKGDSSCKRSYWLTNILKLYCLELISLACHLKDMQSMPQEDLETVNGKAATRYNSALDMMLKVKQSTTKIRFKT